MVGIAGQYIMIVSLGDAGDFIEEENLIRFALVSETGNVLPTFQLFFKSADDDVLNYINEGNRLDITIGTDIDNVISVPLIISRKNIGKYGEGERRIELYGVFDALGYINNDNMYISDKKSGVQVVKDITDKYFETDFNIDSSSDLQYWTQYNITDRNFVNGTYLHSWHPSSFFATAITSDGVFRLYDIKKKLLEDYKWKFTSKLENRSKDIEYGGYFPIDIFNGVINNLSGYGAQRPVNNIEAGTTDTQSDLIETLIALGPFDKRNDLIKKSYETRPVNTNVHVNYWKAYDKNRQYLMHYSSHQVSLVFYNAFKLLNPLDLVMFVDTGVGAGNTSSTSEHYSGLYLVQKVAINVVGNSLSTVIEMTRESSNKNLGEFI
jgi:hypothetical protein